MREALRRRRYAALTARRYRPLKGCLKACTARSPRLPPRLQEGVAAAAAEVATATLQATGRPQAPGQAVQGRSLKDADKAEARGKAKDRGRGLIGPTRDMASRATSQAQPVKPARADSQASRVDRAGQARGVDATVTETGTADRTPTTGVLQQGQVRLFRRSGLTRQSRPLKKKPLAMSLARSLE